MAAHVDVDRAVSQDNNGKQLGTLKFRRAVRINVDDVLTQDLESEPLESERDSILFQTNFYDAPATLSDDEGYAHTQPRRE